MESVLTGLVILMLFLMATFTLSTHFFEAQDDIQSSWLELEARVDEQSRTSLSAVSAQSKDGGTTAELVYRNTGSIKLADFDEWDLIIQYTDSSDPAGYHISWMPLADGAIADNEWSVGGIYLNAANETPEAYEPGILNPGEEIVLEVRIDPALGHGRTLLALLAVGNGASMPLMLTRNIPPVLATNMGLTLVSHTSATVTSGLLASTDADDPAGVLVYTIIAPPTKGDLSLGLTFTQTQIDNGLLEYTHMGDGDDSFQFSVTDGEDVIGVYTFTITAANAEPTLINNTGVALLTGGTVTLTNPMLAATDVDNTTAELTYTVINAPAQGILSMGSIFTQADLDAGLVNYHHTGMGSDTFQFNISDGEATIGPYVFTFQLP